MTSLFLLLVVAFAAAWFARFSETSREGRAFVVDGDSLQIGEERIRLDGIDAPELRQACRRSSGEFDCGRQSRNHLRDLINGRRVNCIGWEYDRYDRLLAECRVGETDLNRRMVADGWATAYGGYEAEEAEARRQGDGMWAGDFDTPRQWRVDHPYSETEEEAGRQLLATLRRWLSNAFSLVRDAAGNMISSIAGKEGE